MDTTAEPLPEPIRRTLRLSLRYAAVMVVVALLSGLASTESARKLSFADAPGGVHLEATIHLALLHGHAFTMGVLLPLAIAGALVLARKAGGREIGTRSLWLYRRLYLPFAALSLALLLYRGYHVLLAARRGEMDFAAIDASLFGGSKALRYGLYGVVHVALTVGLVAPFVGIWRSLGVPRRP